MKRLALPFVVFLGLLAASGCGGSKKLPSTPVTAQPEWVKNRPTSSSYYVGIGWARKGTDVNQYQQAAKQNAQADLASDISVNISTNSVLHAFESNLKFREDFTSTIKAETQQQLEGFEVVDTWEDQGNYWVYYRLSKAEYLRQKEIKKNNAVTISSDLFGKGIDARTSGDFKLAIIQFIKALEPLKPYFSEPLPVEFRGSQIFLGNEIFKELSSTLSSIEVIPNFAEIKTKTGTSIPTSNLQFTLRSRLAASVTEMPVVANYSERPLRENKKRTDRNSLVSFDIQSVRSIKNFETFTVTVDLESILVEATSELFIRKLIANFSPPSGTIRINIEKPILFIEANEINLGEKISQGSLEQALRKKAIESGFQLGTSANEADFIVKLTAATKTSGENGAYKSVTLDGVLTVVASNGSQIYHRALEGFRGTHFEYKTAGEEAFKEARRRIELSFFREIVDAINKK